jgi:type II secretory pathway pseudopilin PulG
MRAVNLIPNEQRSGSSVGAGRSEGAAYAVIALVAALAVMALVYGLARNEVASQRAQAAAAAAKAQQAVTAAERLAPYTSFVAQREQRTQAVETIVDTRFDWAHVFHEIGRVLPLQTSISSLTGTVGSTSSSSSSKSSSSSTASAGASSSAVASATPAGSVPTFTLAGCAISQPAVALMLERLRLIDGVNEVTLQSSTAASGSGSGGGGAGAGGGCPEHDPAFTVAITFDPLPSASAVTAVNKAKNVANPAGASTGAAAAPATTPGGPK